MTTLNPESTMGSVISLRHLQRIEGMIFRQSGTILAGGARLTGPAPLDGFNFSKGNFLPPTVITDVEVNDEIWQEEVFGPVVVVKRFKVCRSAVKPRVWVNFIRFKNEQEGLALANASKYGLGAGIWTSDLSRAHRIAADIQAGLVWVNTHHRNDPSSPWCVLSLHIIGHVWGLNTRSRGGMKESGIGRENGVEAYNAYSQSKSTIVNIAPAEETRKTDDWFAEVGAAQRYG
ncbi:hypothetical protein HWV62_23054 [Athelia sp. TMB]|nr:hypothetical protein HWV62_23054 [Athelia sp. TMB]